MPVANNSYVELPAVHKLLRNGSLTKAIVDEGDPLRQGGNILHYGCSGNSS